MRLPRLKPENRPMFYHLYNRVAGEPGERPFGDVEKEKFVRLLHKLQVFFAVEIISYQIMDNHFHLVVYAPATPPTLEEAKRRYQAYYGPKQAVPTDERLTRIAERMADISCLMHAVQQQFTVWYNVSRAKTRRGTLWASRFKHTLLGDARAVWACLRYVERNAVRAGMVSEAFDYRFCSGGYWAAHTRHPFEEHLKRRVLPILHGILPATSIDCCYAVIAQESPKSRTDINHLDAAIEFADRQTRFWVNGLVIGSKIFVRDMIALVKKKHIAEETLHCTASCPPFYAYGRSANDSCP